MPREYETVIGLEVHVELVTSSKIFCGCSTAFGGEPNAHICPVCAGLPGALPVLNRKVLEHAVAVGLAANCTVARHCRFDRKNYFYPDNPQNYQISQLYMPVCRDGFVEIDTTEDLPAGWRAKDGSGLQHARKCIRIHEIHMEEDAGKLIHDAQDGCTLIDYNRAGVPLIEIVSEPDMRSAEEVIAYLEKLRLMIQYLGASDCKLQEGSMRADVNLSVREAGTGELGTRTEMKNLNSFHAIARAIDGERNRQIALLESGRTVVQETRRWDDGKGISYVMRSKEDARDYRYFPEPDLPPVSIDENFLKRIRARQPEFSWEKRKRYREEYGIPDYDIRMITGSKRLTDFFEETVALGSPPKQAANWLMGETLRLLRERGLDPEDIRFSPENLAKLIGMTETKTINSTVAKEAFGAMFEKNLDPERYVEERGLKLVSDESVLRETVEAVIGANPQSVQDYRGGKDRAAGFLVGQVMKAMRGKADPVAVNRLLRELL